MTSAAPSPQSTRRLRNFLLDARLQLKVTASVLGVTLGVASVLGAFLWMTSSALFHEAATAVEARAQAASASRELGNSALARQLLERFDDPALEAKLIEESKEIDRRFEQEYADTVAQRDALLRRQRTTLRGLIGALGAFALLVALACIVATHRIVGPLFRLKRLAAEVALGRFPVTRGLRPTDELQDVFEAFHTMVEALRTHEAQNLQLLTVAIDRAERSGVPLDVLKELRKLDAHLRQRLEPHVSPPQSKGTETPRLPET